MAASLHTDFAPAERADREEMEHAAEKLFSNPLINILNAVPVPLILINSCRQTVFCNAVFQTASVFDSFDKILGLRPGEALGCVHAKEKDGGCGTSLFCRDCGAASAIIRSLGGENSIEECRILREGELGEEAFDFQVFTSPFNYEGESYILFTALDISHEKRKLCLEQLFFHDILNLVTGLKYSADVLCKSSTSERAADKCRKMKYTIGQVSEEIRAQKSFSLAEEGTLKVCLRKVSVADILNQLRDVYSMHNLSVGKSIIIADNPSNQDVETDPLILGRVLGNMLKNALEATPEDGVVTLDADVADGKVHFQVHNDSFMQPKVQRQIFKRSFSTKGKGRGLGTYSMKLLTENYLSGKVSFVSNSESGTLFAVSLPVKSL